MADFTLDDVPLPPDADPLLEEVRAMRAEVADLRAMVAALMRDRARRAPKPPARPPKPELTSKAARAMIGRKKVFRVLAPKGESE